MEYRTVKCPDCSALVINGNACHETGCPRQGWPWAIDENNQWAPTPPEEEYFDLRAELRDADDYGQQDGAGWDGPI